MASFDTLQKLAAHPEWIAPRSDLRVFLGEPGAPEATKITVEPGNAFSPGMLTFGVTWWLRFPETGTFFAAETASLEALQWRYEGGYLPLIHCEVHPAEGLEVCHSLFQAGTEAAMSAAVCARLRLRNTGEAATSVQAFVALRSLGPAGGPVPDLKVGQDGRSLWLARRDLALLAVDQRPSAVGCGVGDPSALARAGDTPAAQEVRDGEGWCFGLLRFDVTLPAGHTWHVHLDCPQQTYGTLQRELPSTAVPQPEHFDARLNDVLARWRRLWGDLAIEVPDDRFRDAFFAGLGHMLTALVGDQAHIAPLAYPLAWLRDSVFIIRCFDLAGLHDVARAATEFCARNDFFGGFGAEGDAPGQGLWALVGHYRTTRDKGWLEGVYPAIQRKCDWLLRMRRTREAIRVVVDTPTLPFMHAHRATGVICLAAKDGLIQGSMDHGVGHALGWVNHWALCGLREGAYAARELGHEEDARRLESEASELKKALEAYSQATPSFFEHERTVNSLLWPTGAWADDPAQVEKGFNAWWQTFRGSGAEYRPEAYWLYFEFAQAHNALLLGQRERAWQVIDYRLRNQDLPGLYGWREGGQGVGTENATQGVTLIPHLRGCQRFDSITPHGWSQAEMWLLQRAVLVEEWQAGLLLFAGVPRHWLTAGARLGFESFPTWYGRVSAGLQVDETGRRATVQVSGVAEGTPVTVRLGGDAARAVSEGRMLQMHVDLG